jgi:WD40 repeat protein
VIATQDGTLWRVNNKLEIRAIHRGTARITQMMVFPDQISLCIGYSDGTSMIWDAHNQRLIPLTHSSDAIHDIDITPDGNIIALTVTGSTILLGIRNNQDWTTIPWINIAIPARRVALTRDGMLVAIGTEGTIWLYSTSRQTWLCLRTGTAELTQITFDEAEATAFVLDIDGHLMSIDLMTSRRLLDSR